MKAEVFKGQRILTYIVAASETEGFGWNDEDGTVIERMPGSITAHMSMVEWDQVQEEAAVPAPLLAVMAVRGFEFTDEDVTEGAVA